MGMMDTRGSASSAGALMSDGMKVPDRTFSDSIQGTHYQTATIEVLNRIGDALERAEYPPEYPATFADSVPFPSVGGVV